MWHRREAWWAGCCDMGAVRVKHDFIQNINRFYIATWIDWACKRTELDVQHCSFEVGKARVYNFFCLHKSKTCAYIRNGPPRFQFAVSSVCASFVAIYRKWLSQNELSPTGKLQEIKIKDNNNNHHHHINSCKLRIFVFCMFCIIWNVFSRSLTDVGRVLYLV